MLFPERLVCTLTQLILGKTSGAIEGLIQVDQRPDPALPNVDPHTDFVHEPVNPHRVDVEMLPDAVVEAERPLRVRLRIDDRRR